jgi:hypothetical protein
VKVGLRGGGSLAAPGPFGATALVEPVDFTSDFEQLAAAIQMASSPTRRSMAGL